MESSIWTAPWISMAYSKGDLMEYSKGDLMEYSKGNLMA